MRRFFRAAPWFAVACLLALPADRAAIGQDRAERLPGHRNLFNGDCNFLFGDAFMADPTAKYDPRTFAWFIDMLADCGIDTYVNNPCAQLPWYPGKRTPNILTGYRRGDRSFVRGHYPRAS